MSSRPRISSLAKHALARTHEAVIWFPEPAVRQPMCDQIVEASGRNRVPHHNCSSDLERLKRTAVARRVNDIDRRQRPGRDHQGGCPETCPRKPRPSRPQRPLDGHSGHHLVAGRLLPRGAGEGDFRAAAAVVTSRPVAAKQAFRSLLSGRARRRWCGLFPSWSASFVGQGLSRSKPAENAGDCDVGLHSLPLHHPQKETTPCPTTTTA